MTERADQERRKRVRAFKPKTRTGCLTCRSRRIKCDEGKPNCLKCTSTGRKCDGYTVYRDNSIVKTSIPDAAGSISVIARLFVTPFLGTVQEQRSFYFFQQETIPQICGFYHSDFWNRSLLQACCHSSTIRHAAIALGSLHERHQSGDSSILRPHSDMVAGGFALQQYNKAIRLLLESDSKNNPQNVGVALITCILFICFEAIRGHLGSTLSHIDGGVKILSELQSRRSRATSRSPDQSYAPITTLNVLFTRLDIQASSILTGRPLKLVEEIDQEAFGPSSEIPNAFLSLEESRTSLDRILISWSWAIQAAKRRNGDVFFNDERDAIRKQYIGKIRAWGVAFETLLKFYTQDLTDNDLQAIRMLQLQQMYMFVYADVGHLAATVDENIWDSYTSQFETIVSLASSIINATSPSKKPLFSLETSLVGSLYFVASRCRHPRIRRQAIACLRSSKRQEGVWESQIVGHVAQRVMEIEEAAAGLVELDQNEIIPSWARVHEVEPQLDPDGRKGVLHYITQGEVGLKPFRKTLHEILEW